MVNGWNQKTNKSQTENWLATAASPALTTKPQAGILSLHYADDPFFFRLEGMCLNIIVLS